MESPSLGGAILLSYKIYFVFFTPPNIFNIENNIHSSKIRKKCCINYMVKAIEDLLK